MHAKDLWFCNCLLFRVITGHPQDYAEEDNKVILRRHISDYTGLTSKETCLISLLVLKPLSSMIHSQTIPYAIDSEI